MVRIKSSVTARKRKKRVLKKAKGAFGHRSTRYKQATKTVMRGLAYAFRDRKTKKRIYRSLWIVRIKAACQESGMLYSRFIKGLKEAKVDLDRKTLAELAVNAPLAFKRLVKLAQESLPTQPAKKVARAKKKSE